jgi:glycerol-3-phosphate acyltransferase PlsY
VPVVPPVSWGWLVCAAVVGYLVGTVSPAALIARVRGVDIRAAGSGNPGATNVGRVLGRRFGYLVGLLDVAKGFLPALLFSVLVDPLTGMVAGVAAVLGHCTSPWLRGHGGKGVATSFGAILGVEPLWGLVGLGAFLVVFALTRWVALASVLAALWVVVCATERWSRDGDLAAGQLLVWAGVLAVIVLVRHRRNFLGRLSRSASLPVDSWRGLAGWLLLGATLGAWSGAWLGVLVPVAVGLVLGALVAGVARTVVVHRRTTSAGSSTTG